MNFFINNPSLLVLTLRKLNAGNKLNDCAEHIFGIVKIPDTGKLTENVTKGSIFRIMVAVKGYENKNWDYNQCLDSDEHFMKLLAENKIIPD